MKKMLFEKPYTKCGGETIPRPFSKNSKLRISLDQESKSFIQCFYCFYCYTVFLCQVEGYQNILKLNCRSLAFKTYQVFLIRKKWSGTILSVLFSAWFFFKNVSIILFCWLTNMFCLLSFTLQGIGQYI